MTEVQKIWKLKLNFKDGLPNLEKEVNRVYYDFELMNKVIMFYSESGLLETNRVEIEFLIDSKEDKYSF